MHRQARDECHLFCCVVSLRSCRLQLHSCALAMYAQQRSLAGVGSRSLQLLSAQPSSQVAAGRCVDTGTIARRGKRGLHETKGAMT